MFMKTVKLFNYSKVKGYKLVGKIENMEAPREQTVR